MGLSTTCVTGKDSTCKNPQLKSQNARELLGNAIDVTQPYLRDEPTHLSDVAVIGCCG